MRGIGLMSVLLLAFGCRARDESVWLLLVVDPADGIELDTATVAPATAVLERRHEPRRLALRLERAGGGVVVRAPGACPLTLTPAELGAGAKLERRLESLFDLGGTVRVVGYDEAFEIRAVPRCAEAEHARTEFSRTGGAQLSSFESRKDGRIAAGRTLPPDGLARPELGIVPVSAARRAATELRARIVLEDQTLIERKLELAAGTRASGLPNVAVDHSVLMAGDGLRLAARPEGSNATLSTKSGYFELLPDRSGAYGVVDAHGRKLELNAGLYDETPLDCGRSDCHRALGESTQRSPMTSALAADLGGRHPLPSPECALACHATGEPGRRDGGFSDVLADLAPHGALPEKYSDLPRALRRLGGVGCLSCHGPGAIPEASARWAVLRSDVCAVCHDAPPRYGHVAALASSRMARADHDARARDEAACARCHTTWGALAEPERKPPPEAAASGIGCPACHDVHPRAGASAPPVAHLLRDTPVPAMLDPSAAAVRGPSRVCLGCHAPDGERPSASAAAIWAGRGGVEPETGGALFGDAPHAVETRGCIGCHDAGPDSLVLGKNHAFRASLTSCVRCHAQAVPRSGALAARARALLDRLIPRQPGSDGKPPHALAPQTPLPEARQRALYDTLLVLEDPAADVHNPSYAALLLDRAERALRATSRGAAP